MKPNGDLQKVSFMVANGGLDPTLVSLAVGACLVAFEL